MIVRRPLSCRRLTHWALWVALAVHIPIALVALGRSGAPAYDFDRYYEIGASPGRPYLDFPVEQPPATVLIFRSLAALPGGRPAFGFHIVLVNILADATIVAALAWGWGLAAAACFAVVVLPILDLFYNRPDLWSTAAATLAVAAWQRERRVLAGAGLAAGAAFKLWPLPFAVLLFAPAPTTMARGPDDRPIVKSVPLAPIIVFAVAAAALALAWIWRAGWAGVLQVLTFRSASGWEIESTVGSLLMAAGVKSMRVEAGAWRIGTTSGAIAILFSFAAASACAWSIWRAGRTDRVGLGWAGGVSALLAMSALLSPQFAAWLAPGCAVAWAQGDRRVAALTALAILLTNLVWKSFNPLVHGALGPLVMLVARNALLFVVAFDAAQALRRER